MATSNKSKKILEKARKIAAKTKKKKVSKVDVKKKTTSYPKDKMHHRVKNIHRKAIKHFMQNQLAGVGQGKEQRN